MEDTGSCLACDAPDAEFRCSRCQRARFCNAACQRAVWKFHKLGCVPTHGSTECRAEPRAQDAESPPGAVQSGLGLQKQIQAPASKLCAAMVHSAPSLFAAAVQRAKTEARRDYKLQAYPNVGALQGEVQVKVSREDSFEKSRSDIARVMFNGNSTDIKLFGLGGNEVSTVMDLQHEASRGGVIVSQEPAPRHRKALGEPSAAQTFDGSRRYDLALMGDEVLRISADDPELPRLLRCSVPLIITGSGVVDKALGHWDFQYFEEHFGDFDNFQVLESLPESRGSFMYYVDAAECRRGLMLGSDGDRSVRKSCVRKSMSFAEFRRVSSQAQQLKAAGSAASSFYLQGALLRTEEGMPGPAEAVAGFGDRWGSQVRADIGTFQFDRLRTLLGEDFRSCQLFCGFEGGFTPLHYDVANNIFVQVHGWKRATLFHPRYFGALCPWPLAHPQDRSSRVDLEAPDLGLCPRFREVLGRGLEARLGPGDVLHIPSCWWHQIEMLPSLPRGECVSLAFWSADADWHYGVGQIEDVSSISWDRPLFGHKRVIFMRLVEHSICGFLEAAGAAVSLSKVLSVILVCLGRLPLPESGPILEASQEITTVVDSVVGDEGEEATRALFEELLEGRFAGLS